MLRPRRRAASPKTSTLFAIPCTGRTHAGLRSVAGHFSAPRNQSQWTLVAQAVLTGAASPGTGTHASQHSRPFRRHRLGVGIEDPTDIAAGSAAEGREVKCGLSRRHAVLLPLGSRRSHAAITWVQLRPADFMGSVAPDAFPCHRISGRTPNAKFRSAQPASLQAGQKATDDREEASRDRPAPVVAGDSVRHGSGGLHWLGRLLARRRLLPRFIQRDQ